MVAHGLLIGKVVHCRMRPKRNQFTYGMYYLCVPLRALSGIKNAVLSIGKSNLFSFYDCDFANGSDSIESWVRVTLREHGIDDVDRIVLQALPRLFGYSFNPIVLYFCLRADGALRAVISEVNNTFGDRHFYISFHDDGRAIEKDDVLTATKLMHVSPFCEIVGHYQFRFAYSETKIGVWIDYYDEQGLLITTSVTGKRTTLNSKNLFLAFLRYPLITFKVISLIHYQALKLWAKGIRYRVRPKPHKTEITR